MTDDDMPLVFTSDSARRKAVRKIIESKCICFEDAAKTLLSIWHDARIEWAGGYPAEIDWDFFDHNVVVADLDERKEYNAPELIIYDKRQLCDLAQDAIEVIHVDADGRKLKGDDRLDAIIEYFELGIEDCRADRPKTYPCSES